MEKFKSHLDRIRGIANYQFDSDVGSGLFPDEIDITLSKKTGRIRYVYLKGTLLATLRPTNGFFSLTIDGAQRLSSFIKPPRFRVIVQKDVEEFIKNGRNIFARHIIDADQEIRPEEEVMATDSEGKILAVGRALLTGREMLAFKRGVAVKIRRGTSEE